MLVRLFPLIPGAAWLHAPAAWGLRCHEADAAQPFSSISIFSRFRYDHCTLETSYVGCKVEHVLLPCRAQRGDVWQGQLGGSWPGPEEQHAAAAGEGRRARLARGIRARRHAPGLLRATRVAPGAAWARAEMHCCDGTFGDCEGVIGRIPTKQVSRALYAAAYAISSLLA